MRITVKCNNCGIYWQRVTACGEPLEFTDNLQYNCPKCGSNWYDPMDEKVAKAILNKKVKKDKMDKLMLTHQEQIPYFRTGKVGYGVVTIDEVEWDIDNLYKVQVAKVLKVLAETPDKEVLEKVAIHLAFTIQYFDPNLPSRTQWSQFTKAEQVALKEQAKGLLSTLAPVYLARALKDKEQAVKQAEDKMWEWTMKALDWREAEIHTSMAQAVQKERRNWEKLINDGDLLWRRDLDLT